MPNEQLILGLDLGVSSIGYALVKTTDDTPAQIVKMGVRIVPLTKDDETEFSQGNAISKNRDRTVKRTQRKGFDRYQLRRKALIKVLQHNNMMPDRSLMYGLSPLELWGLRARAVTEKVNLQELGRILLHLNQKRGYKHSKTDNTDDSKQTEYVQEVNERFRQLKEMGKTIGQHCYDKLKEYFVQEHKTEAPFRIKEKIYPRDAYVEEFDAIWKKQHTQYPGVLTKELYQQIRSEIIYYQRKLRSQKGLVNTCEFESNVYIDKDGKEITGGPTVAPKASPLFQVEKIWESINNITIKDKRGDEFVLTADHRKAIFHHLDNHPVLTQNDLFKLLNIGKKDGYFTNTLIRKKGIQGNLTKDALIKVLGEDHPALAFKLVTTTQTKIDTGTGEVQVLPIIDAAFEQQPLYKLWHYIYSLEEDACRKKIMKEFNFSAEEAVRLAAIDFTKAGFGNKSARAIRKILPHLQNGFTYDKACLLAGYNHSDSLTKGENLARAVKDKLSLLPKNSLNQPIVEKILNQLINLVNALTDKYGKPHVIRIELARELRQSREERNDAYNNINKRERENEKIRQLLLEHPEFVKKTVSKRDIDRYRLWQEFNMTSPYEPSKTIGLGELYSDNYDIEHIIPRSVRFDDSFSNKTICPRRYNSGENAKNQFTAFDYMSCKRSKEDFDGYLAFIEKAYVEKRISKTKYENLLRQVIDLPADFINRQLNETRYISRKSKEILSQICHHVFTTTGSITQHLRQLWGWDEVLERINLPKYQQLGLVEEVSARSNGQSHMVIKIKDWSKRDDHRHHAIDALAVACTRQGFIQRLNTLNATQTREEMWKEVPNYKNRLSLLDNYLLKYKPFSTGDIIDQVEAINISFKPGKKVATHSSRKVKKGGKKEVVQRHIIEPRGSLSEERVYGKINRRITRSIRLDKKFTRFDDMIDEKQKMLTSQRLKEYNGDIEKAFSNLKNQPVWQDEAQTIQLTHVDIVDYEPEFVIKYPVANISSNDLKFVVDHKVREILATRLAQANDNPKEAFKDLDGNPVWYNEAKKIPIKSVRCFTGIKEDSIIPIKVYDKGWEIEYEKYVKAGNNHHIAIYKNEKGKLEEHVVTFWHAVERKKYGIPVIIKDPSAIWDQVINNRELPQSFLDRLPRDGRTYVTSMQQNECFVFNMSREDLQLAIEKEDYARISPNIYRVRKLTRGSFWFSQQYETAPRESVQDKKAGRCIQASLSSMTGIKVKINYLGEVFMADESEAAALTS